MLEEPRTLGRYDLDSLGIFWNDPPLHLLRSVEAGNYAKSPLKHPFPHSAPLDPRSFLPALSFPSCGSVRDKVSRFPLSVYFRFTES